MILLSLLSFEAQADISKVVDTDGLTGDYASLNAFEAAEEQDLTDGGGDIMTVTCQRSGAGGMDTTAVVFTGAWVTSADYYIKIVGGDFPTGDAVYDNTQYVFHNDDDATYGIQIREDFVRIQNIQFLVTETGANTRYGIGINNVGAGSTFYMDSCIIVGAISGTGVAFGIYTTDADITAYIYNCTISDFLSGGDTGMRCIVVDTGGTINIYNCTIAHSYYGVFRVAGTVTAINCAIFNNTDDIGGTVGTDYCAMDEAGAGDTNGVDISGTWNTDCFTAPEATPRDFSVQDASSPVYQKGNGATPKAVFTDDIIGTTRDAVDLNWDIGAYELIVAAGFNMWFIRDNKKGGKL